MFNSLWNRKGNNKSPAAGQTTNALPRPLEQRADGGPSTASGIQHYQTVAKQQEDSLPPDPAPEPLQEAVTVAAVSTPHDDAVAEVDAKLRQIEQLTTMRRSSRATLHDPLSDAATSPPKPTVEPLFDPATGVQRGFLETTSINEAGDGEQAQDEAWVHLARIRELQNEIAAMHMRMEGFGDGADAMDLEVDADIDMETVPTKEEEEAAKREREFAKLSNGFKGRSDDINAIMDKLDLLSQAVTTFHALQPPPLNFDSASTTRENTRSDTLPQPPPLAEPSSPAIRTRSAISPVVLFGGGRASSDKAEIGEVLNDSPVSTVIARASLDSHRHNN